MMRWELTPEAAPLTPSLLSAMSRVPCEWPAASRGSRCSGCGQLAAACLLLRPPVASSLAGCAPDSLQSAASPALGQHPATSLSVPDLQLPGRVPVCLGALSTPPGMEVGACDCSPVCGVSAPVPGLCQLPPGAEATPEVSTDRGCGPLGPSGPLGLTLCVSHGSPEQTGGRHTDRSRQRYKYHRGSQPSQPAGPATWGV